MHFDLLADCSLCAHCVVPFEAGSVLFDWAYCLRCSTVPSGLELSLAEESVRVGDYSRVTKLGLFELESEDGCNLFEPRDSATVASDLTVPVSNNRKRREEQIH